VLFTIAIITNILLSFCIERKVFPPHSTAGHNSTDSHVQRGKNIRTHSTLVILVTGIEPRLRCDYFFSNSSPQIIYVEVVKITIIIFLNYYCHYHYHNRPRPGVNPRTLGLMESTIIITKPRRLNFRLNTHRPDNCIQFFVSKPELKIRLGVARSCTIVLPSHGS
jgi:hypothetical protein